MHIPHTPNDPTGQPYFAQPAPAIASPVVPAGAPLVEPGPDRPRRRRRALRVGLLMTAVLLAVAGTGLGAALLGYHHRDGEVHDLENSLAASEKSLAASKDDNTALTERNEALDDDLDEMTAERNEAIEVAQDCSAAGEHLMSEEDDLLDALDAAIDGNYLLGALALSEFDTGSWGRISKCSKAVKGLGSGSNA